MAPLRDYLCKYCNYQYEEFVTSTDPDDYATNECRCGSKAELLPSLIGGYTGNMGGSSTRPKNSTSMPKKKVYTGKPGQVDEPENKQLEFDFE